jgi:hypothetical protein
VAVGTGAEDSPSVDVSVFQLGNNVEFHGAIYRLGVELEVVVPTTWRSTG